MEKVVKMKNFYKNKTVFVTGHTGFKGTWLTRVLLSFGARVVGYSKQEEVKYLSDLVNNDNLDLIQIVGDINDYDKLRETFDLYKPQIVFHLAAQAIVSESYSRTVETYKTNVIGTVNLLEVIRNSDSVISVINVTTDKVYLNEEWDWGYREIDTLNGIDPYSNSKSCSELVTSSYIHSFFTERKLPISTCRAGNVIGGGDFSINRIVPDCIQACLNEQDLILRSPESVRPYQHVLEPIFAYLYIAYKQTLNYNYSGQYNIGPNDSSCVDTKTLANKIFAEWKTGIKWTQNSTENFKESKILRLDVSKVKSVFGLEPILDIDYTIKLTVNLYKKIYNGSSIISEMDKQIKEYYEKFKEKICPNYRR
jgi:CDP-glucose 4,6-dehydratase